MQRDVAVIDDPLHRIDSYQEDIRTRIAKARRHTAGAAVAAVPAIEAERPAMLRDLLGYQQFKHQHIFDPAIASAHPLRALAARKLKMSCIAAGEAYRRHVRHWPAKAMLADWPAYAAAMDAICTMLETHLTQERVMVAMLLAGMAGAEEI